jgi:hypothetical protein
MGWGKGRRPRAVDRLYLNTPHPIYLVFGELRIAQLACMLRLFWVRRVTPILNAILVLGIGGPASGATYCLLSGFDRGHWSDLRSGRYNEFWINVTRELRYVNPVKTPSCMFFYSVPVIIGFLFSDGTGCVLCIVIIIGVFRGNLVGFVWAVLCARVGLPAPPLHLLPEWRHLSPVCRLEG